MYFLFSFCTVYKYILRQSFRIRNIKCGACNEVWQWASLWFTGLQLRIQNVDLTKWSDLKC